LLRKSPKPVEVSLGAVPELLVGLVPAVPGGVQVVISMPHRNPQCLLAELSVPRQLLNGAVELFGSFAQMK
jgi:hypothetical protein